jgi:antitoxin component HigA of HigAB toxin-antitoxin module
MMNALAVFTRLNTEQRDYLDVLTEFVDEYDKGKKSRWPEISGLDALKHLMEENEMSAAELSRVLGTSRNLGAMILRGERRLTLAHVRTLARRFACPPICSCLDASLPDSMKSYQSNSNMRFCHQRLSRSGHAACFRATH